MVLTGKVCLVTGATSGIGKATARALAQAGARLVIAGRDPEKGAATTQEIQTDTGNPDVACLLADMSSQAEIRRLAQAFLERYDRLDVLVNNAGAAYFWRQLSADGVEMTFALNHLGYFLLTNLLLERLIASAPSRIVNVSSESHRNAAINFDDLQLEHHYWVMRAYGQSKLANLLFTYELARWLDGVFVTVNAVHPGLVATNIVKNNGWIARLVLNIVSRRALSPHEGADTVIYLAASPEVGGVTGKYFIRRRAVPSSPASYDQASARRLWQLSEELIGAS